MNIHIRKSICQNKNLVIVVNKVIGNIATQLPKKGRFCINKHYGTICLNSIHVQSKKSWRNCCQKNMCDLDQNEAPSYTFSINVFRQHLLQLLVASFNKDVGKRILTLGNNRYRILLPMHYTTHTPCMEIPRRVTELNGSTTRRWRK